MKLLNDIQYESSPYQLSERKHLYGNNVHLLSNPFLNDHLARLCSENTFQPVINELITTIYSSILQIVVSHEFPKAKATVRTRMFSQHPEAEFTTECLAANTPVVSVNLARAGTLPSHVCYSHLNYIMNPKTTRQDHISIARKLGSHEKVSGSEVSGHKIGGSVEGALVLFPDPMGATGSTIVEVMDLYKAHGAPLKTIAIHCIVTPEYLKKVTQACPHLIVYAIRLDRGLSSPKVLQSIPGTYWDEEKGLNEKDYIVPGGGGFGEVLNNAYV